MPHLVGMGWTDLRPLLRAAAPAWLSAGGRSGWLAVSPPEADTGGPIHCRLHLSGGRAILRLGVRGRTPRTLAGLALPAARAALESVGGFEAAGGTVPRPRPWTWRAERPRWRLLEPPPPARCGLEIGFGSGERLAHVAAKGPWWGMESSRQSVDKAARRLPVGSAVLHGDAGLYLPHLPDASFATIVALFPDPWPKERHHGRRWLSPRTVSQLVRLLQPGGALDIATDHPDLMSHVEESLQGAGGLDAETADAAALGLSRSKYAAKASAAGREVRCWRFRRTGSRAEARQAPLPAPPHPIGPPAAPGALDSLPGLRLTGDWGLLKVVEAAKGPSGHLLHLVHADRLGQGQTFLLTHGQDGWAWDPFTRPLPTTALLDGVSALAAASGLVHC